MSSTPLHTKPEGRRLASEPARLQGGRRTVIQLWLHQSRASDLPTTIGCTDAMSIGSFGATDFSRTRPIQHFFEFLLRCFALRDLITSSLGSINIHLTIPLVPLIALSFDHQNHSKYHKWCHVRYTLPWRTFAVAIIG